MDHRETSYDMWPLEWWENPWIWAVIGSVIVCSIIVVMIASRYYRQKAVPKSVVARMLYQVKLLDKLHWDVEADRRYACVLLMQIMRECAYYLFGIVHTSMTDEEFVNAVHSLELPDRFTTVVTIVHTESHRVKFAADEVDEPTIQALLGEVRAYLEAAALQQASHKR